MQWSCIYFQMINIKKTKTEYGYGFFCGGDPRKFYPDTQSCSEAELLNHKLACELWDKMGAKGEIPTPEKCPSEWVFDKNGKPIMHILRAPYGIGGYEYEVEDKNS